MNSTLGSVVPLAMFQIEGQSNVIIKQSKLPFCVFHCCISNEIYPRQTNKLRRAINSIIKQQRRIPAKRKTLCQGPIGWSAMGLTYNPHLCLLPYSAFCLLPFLMYNPPFRLLPYSAFLNVASTSR